MIGDHIKNQPSFAGSELDTYGGGRFDIVLDIIAKALNTGRPALVLVRAQEKDLHWISITGRHKTSGNLIFLNTNGVLYEIPGGNSGLLEHMNINGHIASNLGFVSALNVIACNGHCEMKDDAYEPNPKKYRSCKCPPPFFQNRPPPGYVWHDGTVEPDDGHSVLDPSRVRHIVRPGNTMTHIASAHCVTLAMLTRANPQIKDPNKIRVGQVVYVPTSTLVTLADPNYAQVTSYHTVQKGESLWSIARSTGAKWQRLLDANKHFANPDHILPGQCVHIPRG